MIVVRTGVVDFASLKLKRHGIEICGIELKNLNEKVVNISIYKKPETYYSRENWEEMFGDLERLGTELIICGDFNRHSRQWSLYDNQADNNLGAAIGRLGFVTLSDPATFTRIPTNGERKGFPYVTVTKAGIATSTF